MYSHHVTLFFLRSFQSDSPILPPHLGRDETTLRSKLAHSSLASARLFARSYRNRADYVGYPSRISTPSNRASLPARVAELDSATTVPDRRRFAMPDSGSTSRKEALRVIASENECGQHCHPTVNTGSP